MQKLKTDINFILPSGTVLEVYKEDNSLTDHGAGYEEITRNGCARLPDELIKEIQIIAQRIGVSFDNYEGQFYILCETFPNETNLNQLTLKLCQAVLACTYYAEAFLLKEQS